MTLYGSYHDLIGETPLVELKNMGYPDGVRVFAKLELLNPAGSVKDRIGMYMIEDAEKRGVLKKGSTIVEATAGNTGIGIAFAALKKGYRVIFTVPLKFSEEKQKIMRAYGAEIVNTPRKDGMLGAVAEAERIIDRTPSAISLKQFENMSNPRCHYETTGYEIYRDLDGKIDYAVMGAGSGGTFSGVVGYIKERNPKAEGVLADPVGSIIGGGEHSDYNIEGIGNDFIAKTMDVSLIDRVYKVTDEEAFDTCRKLARREGIMAGQSSGAALAAVGILAEDVGEGNIVTVLPDRGDRYLSKGLFNR
ncbi:MAG: cysteine synthase family protein [Candidatus Methanomethylophilaceae archaeon]|nr:cysteine synthase family protein [Candidatus Methanomethylophilaceae archaeon]